MALCTASCVVRIAGATCSGKTSLALLLQEEFPHSVVIHQDRFYLEDPVEKFNGMYNWDVVSSLNQKDLVSSVKEAVQQPHVLCRNCGTCGCSATHLIVVEGTMILALNELRCIFDTHFFLTLDKATCRQRRAERGYEGEADPPEYFDCCIWPSYLQMREVATAHESVILDSCCQSIQEMHRTVIARITLLDQRNVGVGRRPLQFMA